MLHEQIRKMVRSMAWANDQSLAMLRDCPAAHGAALPLLAHVLAAEHVWLARLERRDALHPVWPNLTLPECERLAGDNASAYLAYLEGVTEPDLASPARYRNSAGVEIESSPIDVLTHVVTHGGYHRGQIARVLKGHGVQATSTDYMMYVRSLGQGGSPPS